MAIQRYGFQHVSAIHSLGVVARQLDYVCCWICTFSRTSVDRYVRIHRICSFSLVKSIPKKKKTTKFVCIHVRVCV